MPSVVTHLFTDLEGSSRLWEAEPDRMPGALALHDERARALVASSHGRYVKTTGDGMHAVFEDPADAIAVALQFQRALMQLASECGLPLRARCGLHAGTAHARDSDFFGSTVNRAARIMAAAHGGQVLVSLAVATLVGARLPANAELRELGCVRLRDLASPETLFELAHPSLLSSHPPLRSLDAIPNNLPLQITSFVGRHGALRELRTRLSERRLVTLTQGASAKRDSHCRSPRKVSMTFRTAHGSSTSRPPRMPPT